jgi:hypothetical protein
VPDVRLEGRRGAALVARRVAGCFLAAIFLASCESKLDQPVSVIPTFPTEKMVYLVPAGWHTAHVVQSTLVDSVEYTPPVQDRSQWTDMVTAAWLDRRMYHHLADVSATLHATLKKKCGVPPATGDLQAFDDNGLDATIETIKCGRTPEGWGHVAIIKTIKSDNGYFQLQRAWRFPATADSRDLAVPEHDRPAAMATLNAFHLVAITPPPPAAPAGGAPTGNTK